jgi:hypothetical protein
MPKRLAHVHQRTQQVRLSYHPVSRVRKAQEMGLLSLIFFNAKQRIDALLASLCLLCSQISKADLHLDWQMCLNLRVIDNSKTRQKNT